MVFFNIGYQKKVRVYGSSGVFLTYDIKKNKNPKGIDFFDAVVRGIKKHVFGLDNRRGSRAFVWVHAHFGS